MSESRYPVHVVRGVPVITAPAALDSRSVRVLRSTLLHLAAGRARDCRRRHVRDQNL